MTKCAFCFTDAFDQICNKCGGSACDNHRDDKGVCPQSHEAPKAAPASKPAAHDDDGEPKPRVKVTKPRSPSSS